MSTSTMAAPQRTSALTPHKIPLPEHNDGERTPTSLLHTYTSPTKPRSLSDAPKPSLSPSPAFREPTPRQSKDDSVVTNPSTPRRPNFHTRGLSLQMPPRDGIGSPSFSAARVPLSPKLDSSNTYGSPTSMLPRRSRGLDFTRACTNLHHSTLAASSPDASPTIGGRGIQIPQRRSMGNSILDSPSNLSSSLWSSMPGERTGLSSSVSSVNMLDSDSDSDTSSDDMAIDRDLEDPMLNTPAVAKLNGNFMSSILNSPGESGLGLISPAQSSLLAFTRARMRGGGAKSRHSSSSVSVSSAKPSPGPLSPRLIQSVETANGGYFGSGLTKQQVQSRRESLSLGTDSLHLSDSEDGESRLNKRPTLSSLMDNSGADGPRGVIRRAVTRRSNLLPKTKNFARIRAALLEESAPIDSEAKREAEVIRQVQESDPTITADTSPVFPPVPFTQEPEASEDSSTTQDTTQNESSTSDFSRHAEKHSAGLDFWHAFDDRYRTPPPTLGAQDSTSALSDDSMETPGSSIMQTIENPAYMHLNRSRSRSNTPLAAFPTAGEVARKANNKRRRDDDFDPASFKRRAVSPGMSVQSSPILPQSPVLHNDKSWGKPPPKHGDRSNSGGSVSNGTKRVGLQGMTETHDGLMNMSID